MYDRIKYNLPRTRTKASKEVNVNDECLETMAVDSSVHVLLSVETFRGVQDLSRTSHIQNDQLSRPCVHDLLAEASQTLYSVSTEDQTTSMTSTVHPGSGQCQVKACKPSTCLFGIWHEWC